MVQGALKKEELAQITTPGLEILVYKMEPIKGTRISFIGRCGKAGPSGQFKNSLSTIVSAKGSIIRRENKYFL